MGKIDRFLAKPMEIELAGQKEMLKPFTLSDLPILTKMGSKDPEVSATAMSQAIKKLLKQIDPEATDVQLEDVSIDHLEELANAIAKVNNLDVESGKADFLKRVKEKQAQMEVK